MVTQRVFPSLAALCAVSASIVVFGNHSTVAGSAGGQRPLAEADACRGVITTSLSADRVRLCDPVTVTTRAEAMCSGCADGLNVVLMMQKDPRTVSGPFQVQAAGDTVQRFRHELPLTRIKVGVVHYGDDSAQTTLGLTDIGQSGAISAAISRAHGGSQNSGAFVGAASQVLRVLAEGRTANGQSTRPCELVVFFAYNIELVAPDMTPWLAAGVEMKKAAGLLTRSDLTLVGICTTYSMPDPPASMACQHVKEIAMAAGGWFAGNDQLKLTH